MVAVVAVVVVVVAVVVVAVVAVGAVVVVVSAEVVSFGRPVLVVVVAVVVVAMVVVFFTGHPGLMTLTLIYKFRVSVFGGMETGTPCSWARRGGEREVR